MASDVWNLLVAQLELAIQATAMGVPAPSPEPGSVPDAYNRSSVSLGALKQSRLMGIWVIARGS